MLTSPYYRLLILGGACMPVSAAAQVRQLYVGTGSSITFMGVATNIIMFMAGAIPVVATAMFVVGAFMVTISGIKEEYRQTGKNLMIGAVMSLAVVLGAYALLRTVDYLLTH